MANMKHHRAQLNELRAGGRSSVCDERCCVLHFDYCNVEWGCKIPERMRNYLRYSTTITSWGDTCTWGFFFGTVYTNLWQELRNWFFLFTSHGNKFINPTSMGNFNSLRNVLLLPFSQNTLLFFVEWTIQCAGVSFLLNVLSEWEHSDSTWNEFSTDRASQTVEPVRVINFFTILFLLIHFTASPRRGPRVYNFFIALIKWG